jgi:hypothetical protein
MSALDQRTKEVGSAYQGPTAGYLSRKGAVGESGEILIICHNMERAHKDADGSFALPPDGGGISRAIISECSPVSGTALQHGGISR